jgi:multiple antibiotic resistance protein
VGVMNDPLRTAALIFVLLNPFLLMIYLIHVVQNLRMREFSSVLLRAGLISSAVFCAFALVGDAVFSDVVQADFASFQIFGGVIFLLIGIQFVFRGPTAIEILRGDSTQLAGAIAMPVFIGPGTISASVLAGKRHEPLIACGTVIGAMVLSVAIIIGLKWLHDFVRPRREPLIQRYIEVIGRIAALFVGTVSVEMIMTGLKTWSEKF